MRKAKRLPPEVLTYLRADRQWPRHLRIQHAEHMLALAEVGDGDPRFWRSVLVANGVKHELRKHG